MKNEPRKASEVLLELEEKINALVQLTRAQDFNNKILSNKLNDVIELLKKQSLAPQKITVEAINTLPKSPSMSAFQNMQTLDHERQIPISAENKLPETNSPQGFRRTSRPETFAGDDVYLNQPNIPVIPQFPTQIPKGPPPGRTNTPEIVAPPSKQLPTKSQPTIHKQQPVMQNAVPVMQRIVDKNGKSVFLADVEITDLSSAQPIIKTRTNGTGKWMASLGVGAYRVIIRKGESLTKSKMEATQDIQVDGGTSPLELQTMIIR